MKKYIYILLVSFMVILSSNLCGASLIDFEDLYPSEYTIHKLPTGYAGYIWSDNAYYYTIDKVIGSYIAGSGYEYGMFNNVAIFNSGATELSITFNGPHDFTGTYITSAWLLNQSVTVEGWYDGNLLYSETIVTSYNAPYYFDYYYEGIDKVVFLPGAGTSAGLAYNTLHIVLDNIDPIETRIPEPLSVLFIGLGLLGIATLRKII